MPFQGGYPVPWLSHVHPASQGLGSSPSSAPHGVHCQCAAWEAAVVVRVPWSVSLMLETRVKLRAPGSGVAVASI